MIVNAIIRLTERLPLSAKAFSFSDLDGNYYIYINECLCERARIEALEHEVEHIQNNDFCSDKPVEEKERRNS